MHKEESALNCFKKVLLPVLLIIALMAAVVPAFAEGNASEASIDESVIVRRLGNAVVSSAKFNGKAQKPKVIVTDLEGQRVDAKYYTVKVFDSKTKKFLKNGGKNAGTYTVEISGKGIYTGTLTRKFVIKKIANPFWIKAAKVRFKKSTKTQSAKIAVSGLKGKAKLSAWSSTNPNVYVKKGKIYVKSGFKGKAVLSISSKSTTNYKATTRKITIVVK